MGTRLAVLLLIAPAAAASVELGSASYRLRGAHTASVAAASLAAPGPRYAGSGVALGQADALGFSSGAPGVTTQLPGFWPVVAGGLPNLDLDLDGVVAWLDPDDDGDLLLDAVETGTGTFVSSFDTGSDPANADSDADGFGDGDEVAGGTDPNDAASFPILAVPALGLFGLLALAFGMLASSRKHRRLGACA